MRKALVFLIVLAALAIPAVASANLHATDPTGDSGIAPDITTVDVTNDTAGNITFTVGFVPRTFAPDENFLLAINTDANPATGSPGSGTDVLFDLNPAGHTYGYEPWNGSSFQGTTQHGTINVSLGSASFTITVNKADLGNTSKFTFFVLSDKGPGDSTDVQDSAPDGNAVYTYSLATVTGVQLRVTPGVTVKGGKTVSVTAAIKLSDGTTAKPDSVTCTAKANGKPVTSSGGCSFRAPKSARGKTMTIKVTISYQGQTFTSTVVVRIKK